MILLVDNYDSFTYNLAQYLGELTKVNILRNDDPNLFDASVNADALVFSPGPGHPSEAGNMEKLIDTFKENKPILGICLGHQAIGEVFGGCVSAATTVRHGKISQIKHTGKDLFKAMPTEISVMRYHSLIMERSSLPDVFDITAIATDDQEIMAMKHKDYPIYGFQFHPESIGTPQGKQMLQNFIEAI